ADDAARAGRPGKEFNDALRLARPAPERVATRMPARVVANPRRVFNPAAVCSLLAGILVATHLASVV
ncbi:MAG TPA: hypothetical protein VFZ28_14090, partial [Burkholderiaceae bacterium]|nr:hypothetical protein [Burkholderiaceae bacterium]